MTHPETEPIFQQHREHIRLPGKAYTFLACIALVPMLSRADPTYFRIGDVAAVRSSFALTKLPPYRERGTLSPAAPAP
jgi:hypothetical protein